MAWTILPASQFPNYARAWTELNAANGASQLLDFTFIEAARRSFGSGEERLGLFEDNGRVRCMGLFTPVRPLVWQTFQPANAPLGAWLNLPGDSAERLALDLLKRLPGIPLVFGISQQDPDILRPPHASSSVGLLDYIVTPRLVVEGSFAEYWNSRSKNTRHNIKRQLNRMQRESLAARLEIVTAPEEMKAAVADYAELETRGWKGRANSAVTAGDRQSAFYEEILVHYAAQEQAAVWRYFLGDRLAASNLCIEHEGVLIILKTAYEEAFQGLSPAQLMNYEALRWLFDRGRTRRIEFYGPVKEWHRRLTDDVRTLYHANFYRWPWLKGLLATRGKQQMGTTSA